MKPPIEPPKTAAHSAIDEYARAEYKRGFEQGLSVAETIRAWLTRQPDNDWQRELRQWTDRAIENARENVLIRGRR